MHSERSTENLPVGLSLLRLFVQPLHLLLTDTSILLGTFTKPRGAQIVPWLQRTTQAPEQHEDHKMSLRRYSMLIHGKWYAHLVHRFPCRLTSGHAAWLDLHAGRSLSRLQYCYVCPSDLMGYPAPSQCAVHNWRWVKYLVPTSIPCSACISPLDRSPSLMI